MLLSNIVGGIEIGIQAVATCSTAKEGLRTAIVACLVPTTRARLRGVARINLDHPDALGLRLVGQKRMKLCKAPRVDTPLPLHALAFFAATNLRVLTDVGQVLKDQRATRRGRFYEAFGEDVIMVFSLPQPLTRKFFQVPFSRFCAFRLQFPAQAKHASFLFFPATLSQKGTGAGHGWTIEPKVNPNHLTGRIKHGSRKRDNDMQKIASVVETQIGRASLPTHILPSMVRDGERNLKTARDARQAGCHAVPLDPVGVFIIADGSTGRLGTTNRLEGGKRSSLLCRLGNPLWIAGSVFFLPGQRRFHGFSRFDASSADQLSRQVGVLSTQWIVSAFMQGDAITASSLKTCACGSIETGSVLLHCSVKESFLLRSRMELCNNRSMDRTSISKKRSIVNMGGYSVCGQHSFLPMHECKGLQNEAKMNANGG